MNIGVPRERRPFEFRVGLPPAGVRLFAQYGHIVYVESGAGDGAGFSDQDFSNAGANVVFSEEEVFGRADLVLKFARPLRQELELIQEGKALAGFLHLAAARKDKIDAMLQKKLTVIAYERIEEEGGFYPVFAPLSQIGGRMAVQIAARLLQNDHGGRGVLLGGVAGVPSPEIVILGAGTVGSAAAAGFISAGTQVTVLDIDLRKLQELQSSISAPLVTMLSTPFNINRVCAYADVLLGAVLVPGERSPIIVTRKMVSNMKPRAIIIDMSIDQGGCIETSRPTNHGSPTFEADGVIHYCVPNISGVLGRTASHALFNGAYPYLKAIAEHGLESAIDSIPAFEKGLHTRAGEIVHLKRLGEPGDQSP
ncbi:MAG: alanine dehydrogenase [Anaerolineales bacterium]|nr:alanine dehydrogenase [Anaerolineales bacterium]